MKMWLLTSEIGTTSDIRTLVLSSKGPLLRGSTVYLGRQSKHLVN